jgi:hypothetical protein
MSESSADRCSRSEELVVLVELEAHWENLRAARTSAGPSSLQELQRNQRAYEAFHSKLIAYNKRHAPAHIPELLINTADRLEQWCDKMSALFAGLADGAAFPSQLLEKAYRLADRIATQKRCERAVRPTPGARSAVRELQVLVKWCTELPDARAAA